MVHTWDPAKKSQTTVELGPPISFAIPREAGGMVIGRQHSICAIDADGTETELVVLRDQPDDVRFNDAKCDRAGRLWAGTMSISRTRGRGALYRLGLSGAIEEVIGETTISNGLGWSPNGDRMYFIDSPTQRIDVFDFDLAAGELANRRPFAAIDPDDGLPDGLTVDAEGGIWLCLFGGGALRRYSPSGELEATVELETSNPTSPTFGGPRLETLYVTTAKHKLTADQLATEPLAGSLFALEPGVRGLPANRFAG